MGLVKWFFYSDNTGSSQTARRNMEAGTPQTATQALVMRHERRREEKKNSKPTKWRKGPFYWK